MLEDNKALKERLAQYNLGKVAFFTFENSRQTSLNGWMITPPDFDENKKYPVFMYVYGGPGSQTVNDAWGGQNYMWFQMLAQNGYIVVSVDNSGTGARGEKFKKMTYQELGKYETQDQIEAAKYLAGLDYVDGSRIGIFGWSYGGYMSSLCLFKGNDVFKSAIAIAPVTNWKWYDSIYTERYMRTPQENKDGYEDNSPINFVERLKGNYLLVHGITDDNVHFQNTAEMTRALISANKQFDTYFYPNRNHGIYGDNARIHLYTKMTNFVLEKL
jgi:dipeptidyl-peptidase-4